MGEGTSAGDSYGRAVAGVGDVNGDGFDDVLIGAENATWQAEWGDSGAAFLYLGSSTGPAATPAWSWGPPENNASFGAAVAGLGDIDGDGKDDVVIGAWRHDAPGGLPDAGGVYVFLGTAGGLTATPAWTAEGSAQGEQLGRSVAGPGDLDGDGFRDLAVGAPGRACEAGLACGAVVVARGGVNGLLPGFDWMIEGSVGEGLGAGLWGGDGRLLAAAPGVGVGEVHLFDGLAPPTWSTPGASAAWVGADILIGPVGALFSGTDQTLLWTYGGLAVGAIPGGAGDVDGDGWPDLLLGAGQGAGLVHLVVTEQAGPLTFPAWIGQGAHAGAAFGSTLASAGDVNDDGFGDLVIGSPGEDAAAAAAGRARVYLGDAPDTDGDGTPDAHDCAPNDPLSTKCEELGDDDDSTAPPGDDDAGDDDADDDDAGDDDAGDDDVTNDDDAEPVPSGGSPPPTDPGCSCDGEGPALLLIPLLAVRTKRRRTGCWGNGPLRDQRR
jgi:hypothetical protein